MVRCEIVRFAFLQKLLVGQNTHKVEINDEDSITVDTTDNFSSVLMPVGNMEFAIYD